MQKNGKVFQNSILYALSAFVTKGIGFLMLPVYTRLLATEGYGAVNLITSFVGVASYVAALSLYSAILRFYTEFEQDRAGLKRFFGTVMCFLLLSGGAFLGLALIFREPLTRVLFEGLPFYPLVLIGLLLVFFSVIHTAHTTVLQAMQQGKRLTAINIALCLAQAGLTLILLLVFRLGASGVLLSQLTVYIAYGFFAFFDLKRRDCLTFCLDGALLKRALAYSIPILPHNLSTNIAAYASKLFLNNAADLSSVGLYGVANQFSMVIDTIQASVNRAFMPWFFQTVKQGEENSREEITRVTRTLLMLYSLLYLGIGLFSEELLVLIAGKDYHEAWRVIPLIVAAFSVKSVYYFTIDVLMYHQEAARRIFLATVTGSLMDILLAAALVGPLGMYGSALAFLGAKIVVVVIIAWMARPYRDQPLSAFDQFLVVLPGLVFLALGLLPSYLVFDTGFYWQNVLIKLAALGGYLAYMALTNREIMKTALTLLQKFLRGRRERRHGIQ